MSEWIQLNQAEVDQPQRERIRGVEVEVFMSPYDVPEAVRGDYIRQMKRFVIEFKYVSGDESLIADEQVEHIRLMVGKHSHRLYRIEIDIDNLVTKQVDLRVHIPDLLAEVDQAIERLASKPRWPSRQGNYRTARNIIREKRGQLVGALN